MQIVVPMSGQGERFRRAGYAMPKPLIEVEGKPIIAHVVDLFPGERDFLFICNEEDLAAPSLRLRETLERWCPGGRIVAIAPHKLGPVHAVRAASGAIDPARPVIVNYCDFACYWDYADFRSFVEETRCDGAIPAYRGFHPHSLGSTFYAYLREQDGWATDIQEKRPFTDTPMHEFASSGTYYFSSGALMLEAFEAAMRKDLRTGGEFYVSLAYKPLFAVRKRVAVYELQHFMQWGTPEDLEEYLCWSDVFRCLAQPEPVPAPAPAQGFTLVPMAGLGERFRKEGFRSPKPLVEVSGRPMFLQAIADLPPTSHTRIVLREDLAERGDIEDVFRRSVPGAEVRTLPAPTDGQARTCILGLEGVGDDELLTIGACDNGVLYDRRHFANLVAGSDWDVLVWGVRGHPPARRRPEHYGWIAADAGGRITGVSVKRPLADTVRDPIVIGAFTFRRAGGFRASAEHLFGRDGRVNGEFYVDSCINDAITLGLRCRLFEVDRFLCWGTPDELRTFEYWQSCFDKWTAHPYRLELDGRIPPERVPPRRQAYGAFVPRRPPCSQ
ncbi:MAG: NTP transferase domain-containing protein [Burkholderiales bacterium]|nr:NTP transferase domain-containing protein [Burkholderiales bacterium]